MRLLYISILILLRQLVLAQAVSDSLTIDEVTVTVERLESTSASSIKSVEKINPSYLKLNSGSINDHLEGVSGLYINNGYNYAQDTRLAIRGFGARSAFGIRGVKIIVDGIPETTPDGQGQMDNLNLAAIERIEVLKTGSSSLYGNASGGVININTKKVLSKDYINASAILGSYGLQRYDIGIGKKYNKSNVILNANYTDYKGYRTNSELTSYNINGRWNTTIDKHFIDLTANYTNSPKANDPGGINIEQAESDRRSARDRNLSFASGESIQHAKLGIQHKYLFNPKMSINNYAFASTRDFVGSLPFENSGYIDLNRIYYGLGSAVKHASIFDSGINKLISGLDIGVQRDERDRSNNVAGTRGDLVFSQVEKFVNVGLYLQNRLAWNKWSIEGGLRYDMNRLSVDDRNLTNGDHSDQLILNSFNGNIGVCYNIGASTLLRTQWSTSFETPTLSELSADPMGTEGFNDALKPMSASTIELGLRSSMGQVDIDATLFIIDTDDEILSYEIEQFPNRDFFRNAGNSSRLGVELDIRYQLTEHLNFNGSYTHLKAQFEEYRVNGNNLAGNTIPGIPENRFTFSADWNSTDGPHLGIQILHTGHIFLNDSNSISAESFQLINFHSSYTIKTDRFAMTPFINIANLTGTQYFGNLRINAFGARYYEPAPDRQYIGGLKITF